MGYTIQKIKAENARAGQYFFERGTMRFFNSRILERVHQGAGGIYFVTSERFDDLTPRLYTVRRFDPTDASVDTVGGFQAYKTSHAAHAVAACCARFGPDID